MNSNPGTVWYPKQPTGSPTPHFGPPTRFGSPRPQLGLPSENFSSPRPVAQLVGHFGPPPPPIWGVVLVLSADRLSARQLLRVLGRGQRESRWWPLWLVERRRSRGQR
ncbi:hypothetical protein Hanom_Chr17g01555851 [Helianthus anomalus]